MNIPWLTVLSAPAGPPLQGAARSHRPHGGADMKGRAVIHSCILGPCGTQLEVILGFGGIQFVVDDNEPAPLKLARSFVSKACAGWSLPEGSDTAALVTSELVTNAVVHAKAREITVCIALGTENRIEIDVLAPGQGLDYRPLRTRQASLDDVSGRGLAIVDAVAEEWGDKPHDNQPGGHVWAILRPEGAAAV